MLPATSQTPLPTPLDVSGLVELTGGRSVYAEDNNYEPLFRALAEEVTSAYVLAFYPPEEKRRDGQFHNIRIEGPAGLTLRQSRPGYQAAKASSRQKQVGRSRSEAEKHFHFSLSNFSFGHYATVDRGLK